MRTGNASLATSSRSGRRRGRPLLAAVLVLALAALGLPAIAWGDVAPTATRTDSQRLVATNRQVDAEFGVSVAIDGDRIVGGAPLYDFFGQRGMAQGFAWAGSDWQVLPGNIVASDSADGDRFGISCAIDRDTLVVGASFENGGDGAAYVYAWQDGNWEFTQKLIPPSPRPPGARFGESVAVFGDWLLVGAPSQDRGAEQVVGAVHVFTQDGSSWTYDRMLEGWKTSTGDRFGFDVAIDGSILIAGAPGTDSWEGSAYTFEWDGTDWVEGQELSDFAGDGGRFGHSVDVDGRYAIVGCPEYAKVASDQGAAIVFRRHILTSWGLMHRLQAADGAAGDELGWDVAIEDRIAVASAWLDSDGASENGSAYIWDRESEVYEGWVERDKLLASDAESDDAFGFSLDLSGDTAVVGALGHDDDRGAAYAFEGILGPYAPVEVAGATRYDTAIAASQQAFPQGQGGADRVVIATGENWPDALGGAALAGAYDAPILLVGTSFVPDAVIAEIDRLNADEGIILGGPGAVSPAVEALLASRLGASTTFRRIGGATRYETADLIAREVRSEAGDLYDGTAFVATGLNFPDALAASPLAAAGPHPILLAPPTGLTASTLTTMDEIGVEDVVVLGGTGVVSQAIEDGLASGVSGDVTRLAGPTRYETAVEVATYGVEETHLRWNRMALATGENFPDALAGGPMQARARSVMLLTHSAALTPATRTALEEEARQIAELRFLGGTGALTQAVRDDVKGILE